MDVSFSVPTWKVNQIQNIDTKLQEEFYASTPYNLNDFKQTNKLPEPIFKLIESTSLRQSFLLKKKLIKNQNISLAIFITYLYEFLSRVISKIQNKNNSKQHKKNTSQNFHQQKHALNQQPEKQTQRGFISEEKKQINEQFEILKTLKLKIYQIDLCRLKEVPEKFKKYYNNNLMKKIIFQYLSKAFYNISLIQILLENNQVLSFALSLVSRSLLCKKNKISFYNQSATFYQQAQVFLQHFQNFDVKIPSFQSSSIIGSALMRQDKTAKKIRSSEDLMKLQQKNVFKLTRNQMKCKYASFEEQDLGQQKIYLLCLHNSQDRQKSLKKDKNKNLKNQKKQIKQKSVKSILSNKSVKIKSQPKIKKIQQQKSWMNYLGCLKYFFSDSPKK